MSAFIHQMVALGAALASLAPAPSLAYDCALPPADDVLAPGTSHHYPAWSPDGAWIAFTVSSDAAIDVYRVRPDGTGLERLTDAPLVDAHPAWAADGQTIFFDSTRDGHREAYAMTAGGCRQHNLTKSPGSDGPVALSPDGSSALWNSDRAGQGDQIYRASVTRASDGSWTLGPAQPLTSGAGPNQAPVWSPDGRMILFESRRDGNREIYIMNGDGSEQRNLTNHPAHDSLPKWSPDGRRLVFFSRRDGDDEVYVMAADGSAPTRLTQSAGPDRMPAWSPDASTLVFSSDRSGSGRLYLMSPDGTNLRSVLAD
jgi:TolB protein